MIGMGRDDCARARKRLEAYYEGVLPPREAELVAAHLWRCEACAHELGQIRSIATALEALPEGIPNVELASQISSRVARLPAPLGRRRLAAGWRRVEALAALTVAALALWRYLFPLLLTREAGGAPLVRWLSDALVLTVTRAEAWSLALHDLWLALRGASGALELAAAKAAPICGLYALAELGMIAAVVVVSRFAHRLRSVSLTLLA